MNAPKRVGTGLGPSWTGLPPRGRRALPGLVAVVMLAGGGTVIAPRDRQPTPVRGTIRTPAGAARGALVTLRATDAPIAHTVAADAQGRFDFGTIPDRTWTVEVTMDGFAAEPQQIATTGSAVDLDLALQPSPTPPERKPAAAFLALLPDGPDKRRFILDCTGCHTFDALIAMPAGQPRTHAGWVEAVGRMLGFAGPASGFPVIAAGREPQATADFLTRHVGDDLAARLAATPSADPTTANAILTEYAIPEPGDLPHDVALPGDGTVLITGMFTHQMYSLNPESGAFETTPIPVQNANPRAVEIGEDGSWWVLLGGPNRIAKYDPRTLHWSSFPIGVYGHSIGLDREGRAWFNGHFSRNPEVLGYVDAQGEITRFEVPAHPEANIGAGPIPYELRVAPDGRIWVTELVGNRVFSYDPSTARYEMLMMPTPYSGPRRLDIGPDGTVWIPEYANNTLARFRPGPVSRSGGTGTAQGELEEFQLPIPDAEPYVVRVDPRNGKVWIGTGSADAILSFDPTSERFTVYRLPTRGALIRHLAIDPRNGDVWAAYGASPGIPSKVARLRVRS